MCVESAKTYGTLREFRSAKPMLYAAAHRNGWLPDLRESLVARPSYDLRGCSEAAGDCATRNEFKKRFVGAYRAAIRNGWIDDICRHMPRAAKPAPRRWTMQACAEIASCYSDIKTLASEHRDMVATAYRNGWMPVITSHMNRLPLGRSRKWTFDACAADARNFTTRTDYRAASPSSYSIAKREGWLDEICSHMRVMGNKARRVVYVIRLNGTRLVYVGLSMDAARRYEAHKSNPAQSMREFMGGDHHMIVVTGLVDAQRASAHEISLVERLRGAGWVVVNAKKAGGLGGSCRTWTFDRLQEVARTCRSSGEFRSRHPSAYTTACARGYLRHLFPKRRR